MLVATTAMLSGIGGAAMFTPIFLIVFPLLGPEYVLESTVAAIGVALLTETFGFSSGFVGYFRKRLIDFRSSLPFIAVAVPVAVTGALVSHLANGTVLKAAYAVLMMILAIIMIKHKHSLAETGPVVGEASVGAADARPTRTITARDGTVYQFRAPHQGKGAAATGLGAFLTGMVSVGIGEVIMPQLAKRNRVPIPVAAATSVFVVIVTVASASFMQISQMVAEGGMVAVPWNLVIYTVPGVIIGGQIGPWLQGKISHDVMERAIGILFAAISLSMVWLVITGVQGGH
ncbi:MAG: sulfite exporter TauE/SafE family protein [Sphingomonadales bacterium]